MAKTAAQIDEQIAKLQREKAAIKAKEIPGVIARIKQAIAYYELTPEDIFGRPSKVRNLVTSTKSKTKSAASRKVTIGGFRVPVKYRDEAGNTWTGRGTRPRWLAAALSDGQQLEDFEVKR